MNFWNCVCDSHFWEKLIQMLVKRRKKRTNYIGMKFYNPGIKIYAFLTFLCFYAKIVVFYYFLTILKFLRIFLENRCFFFFQSSIKYKFRTWISGWDSRSKLRNPVEMNCENERLLACRNFGFPKIFPVMKQISLFPKKSPIFM